MDNAIHVAFTLYDANGTYSRHFGVVMTSIFEHTESSVVVHILHDDTLTADNRAKFVRTAEKYGQSVEFVNMQDRIALFGKKALRLAGGVHSHGALLKMMIPYAIGVDRAIYLDGDVLVGLDIAELWGQELNGKAIGAVLDHGERKRRQRFTCAAVRLRLIGSDIAEYFNSGVMLMDLKKIRAERDLPGICPLWYAEHAHHSTRPDQDFLNSNFRGDVAFLPAKFNVQGVETADGIILHVSGDIKPWHGLSGNSSGVTYWRMFTRSAWGEDMSADELIAELSRAAASNKNLHMHSCQCWRRLCFRIWNDVILCQPIQLLYMYIRERMHRMRARREQVSGDE